MNPCMSIILHVRNSIISYYIKQETSYVLSLIAGDHSHQLFLVQGSLSQQSLLLHDAAHRRTVHFGGSPEHHCASILDHQASKKSMLPWLHLCIYFNQHRLTLFYDYA